MDYSKDFCIEKYARVAQAMGLTYASNKEGADAAVAEVSKLSGDVGIPPFSSLGISETQFEEIAVKSYENLSNSSNPRFLEVGDYMEILKRLNS